MRSKENNGYEKPMMEVIQLDSQDIIIASTGGSDDGSDPAHPSGQTFLRDNKHFTV